jgi:uncharacterized protein YdhG (YjbR/CyaY superfamily)
MQSSAETPSEYIASLPAERREVMFQLRKILKDNLPEGFEEGMGYGMLSYHVPHSVYPDGYHCNPKDPLPFINLASQKNYIALYHMGLYADKDLHDWFLEEYSKYSTKKPDMGKSCIRFKKMQEVPYELIGKLASKMRPQDWISLYEKQVKK